MTPPHSRQCRRSRSTPVFRSPALSIQPHGITCSPSSRARWMRRRFRSTSTSRNRKNRTLHLRKVRFCLPDHTVFRRPRFHVGGMRFRIRQNLRCQSVRQKVTKLCIRVLLHAGTVGGDGDPQRSSKSRIMRNGQIRQSNGLSAPMVHPVSQSMGQKNSSSPAAAVPQMSAPLPPEPASAKHPYGAWLPQFPAAVPEIPTCLYSQIRSRADRLRRFREREFFQHVCLVNGNDPAEFIRNLAPLDASQGVIDHLRNSK